MKSMLCLMRSSVVIWAALLMGIATAQADPLAPILQVAFGGTVEDYGAPQESLPQGWYPFFLDNWWLGPSDTLAHNKAWYGSASMTYLEVDLVDASLHTVTLTDIDNHGGFESWIVGGSGYATS